MTALPPGIEPDSGRLLFEQWAEERLLGSAMVYAGSFERVSTIVKSSDFAKSTSREIWRVITQIGNRGGYPDLITVMDHLDAAGLLEAIGGHPFLAELCINAIDANLETAAKIVRNLAIRRRLISASTKISSAALHNTDIDQISQTVYGLVESAFGDQLLSDHVQNNADVMLAIAESLDQRTKSTSSILGRSTGLIDIDNRIDGLCDSCLYILAARPRMGKSALALQIAINVAKYYELPVYIWSGEMPSKQVGIRQVIQKTGIPGGKIRKANLSNQEWDDCEKAMLELKDLPLIIDDQGALSIQELRIRTRREQAKRGNLGLIVVDYLQLMDAEGNNREQEVANISRGLKALAKELNCPVLALAQINRSVEQRADKRPQMNDLRESGAIEADADAIAMLYREVVYNTTTALPNVAEVIWRKNREGDEGTDGLLFDGPTLTFKNLVGGVPSAIAYGGSVMGSNASNFSMGAQ